MQGFWKELKTRKIFRVATVYAALAWGIIQIADILLPVLQIDDYVMSSLVLTAFIGFPIALSTGWIWDIRLQRRADASPQGGINPYSRWVEFVVIVLFAGSAGLLYQQSAPQLVAADTEPDISVEQLLAQIPQQKAIAVLPFVAFSSDPEDQYFADGLADEILNRLARNKQLRVAARTSSFQFKGKPVDARQIGAELGVDYIVEGSVRRSGNQVRISAQLVRVSDSFNVFADSWDRTLEGVFEVQDEISRSVMSQLEVNLLSEEQTRLADTTTNNVEALAEYAKGVSLVRNRGKADFENAVVHFRNALTIDPDYAEAMTMLAETYLLQVSYGYRDYDSAAPLADELLTRAALIDPQLADVKAVRGLYFWQRSNMSSEEQKDAAMSQAKQALAAAIELNPSHAEAFMWLGSILQIEGEFVDGSRLRKKAYELDPRAAVVGFNRAEDLVRYGRFDDAMAVFNHVVRNNPNYANAYYIAGEVSFQVGQLDNAMAMYRKQAELTHNRNDWLLNLIRVALPVGAYDEAQQALDILSDSMSGEMKYKLQNIQAELWVAANDWESLINWAKSLDTDNQWGQLVWRGIARAKSGELEDAIADFEESLLKARQKRASRIDELTVRVQLYLAYLYRLKGDALTAEDYLQRVANELDYIDQQGIHSHSSRHFRAALLVQQGHYDQALAVLNQSIKEGFVSLWWIEQDPLFLPIANNPQFVTLKEALKARLDSLRQRIELQQGSFNEGFRFLEV